MLLLCKMFDLDILNLSPEVARDELTRFIFEAMAIVKSSAYKTWVLVLSLTHSWSRMRKSISLDGIVSDEKKMEVVCLEVLIEEKIVIFRLQYDLKKYFHARVDALQTHTEHCMFFLFSSKFVPLHRLAIANLPTANYMALFGKQD